jgi:hypothetical protein
MKYTKKQCKALVERALQDDDGRESPILYKTDYGLLLASRHSHAWQVEWLPEPIGLPDLKELLRL